MDNITTTPEYLFESSWEVCNKVGGIYTVLSTKAHTLLQFFKDKLIFIGPDVWANTNAPDFIEDDVLFADWKAYTKTTDNLKVKVGRWNVPGMPPVILVGFKPFFKERGFFFLLDVGKFPRGLDPCIRRLRRILYLRLRGRQGHRKFLPFLQAGKQKGCRSVQ